MLHFILILYSKKTQPSTVFRFATIFAPKKCQKLRKIVILSVFVVKIRQKPHFFCFFTATQRSYFGTLSRPSYVEPKREKERQPAKVFPSFFASGYLSKLLANLLV